MQARTSNTQWIWTLFFFFLSFCLCGPFFGYQLLLFKPNFGSRLYDHSRFTVPGDLSDSCTELQAYKPIII